MVGTHSTGFDRLVAALDEYARLHPGEEVVIQAGNGLHRPLHARTFAFKASLKEDIARADLVVSQGSIGFLEALELGKRLVVVPRLARFGEAIDDHQVLFAQNFSRRFGFPVVLDIAELGTALERAATGPAPASIRAGEPTGLHRDLSAYLEGLARNRSRKKA